MEQASQQAEGDYAIAFQAAHAARGHFRLQDHEVDDVLHNALAAWTVETRKRRHEIANIPAYIRKIVWNAANAMRRTRPSDIATVSIDSSGADECGGGLIAMLAAGDDPAEIAAVREFENIFLAGLSKDNADVWTLYRHGHKPAEIAQAMGKTRNAVDIVLHRLRIKFWEMWTQGE